MRSAISARLESTRYMLRAADGARGALGVARFLARNRLPARADSPPVRVRMRALGGHAIAVRPRTSDMYNAASYYAYELYLPPPQVRDEDLKLIVELGTNIGAALAALGTRYPSARLIGVEPDPANLALARINVARFSDRVTLVGSGVWDRPARLVAEDSHGRGAHGLTIREVDPDEVAANSIEAVDIDGLLAAHAPDRDVDYMHISIEGTEPRILEAGGDWPERVRSLRVELHPYFSYEAEQCIPQLEALGYDAWPAPEEPTKWIYATRRSAAA